MNKRLSIVKKYKYHEKSISEIFKKGRLNDFLEKYFFEKTYNHYQNYTFKT